MIGVDEVGRGCLAGPLLVVAARATSDLPGGLKDSKLLTRMQRQKILETLITCCSFGEGWVSASEIDEKGLANALRLGLARALQAAEAALDEEIIYDGPVNYAPAMFKKVQCLIDADELVPLVSAASIYAKVKRDRFMIELKKKFPKYGFEHHVGYSTLRHRQAIESYGPIDLVHRLSFAPFRQLEIGL
jgi:ribonuclease HII